MGVFAKRNLKTISLCVGLMVAIAPGFAFGSDQPLTVNLGGSAEQHLSQWKYGTEFPAAAEDPTKSAEYWRSQIYEVANSASASEDKAVAQAKKSISGDEELANANQQFANPLTQATMVITENDTLGLRGDLVDGTEVTNITVFEPIIPYTFDNGWALINRPILPFAIDAPIPVAGSGGSAAEGGVNFEDKTGLGDFTFFSMIAPPTDTAFKWGVGPVFRFPTSTKDELGSGKYTVGPAAVALYSSKNFTIGGLTQSFFSVGGDDDRDSVATSTFQYFAFYNFTPQWGVGMAPIISVNWDADGGDKVSLPVGLGVTRTFRIGDVPARLLTEGQYYAVDRDSFGPRWNARVALALMLPPLFN